MTNRERFTAVLDGEKPDRAPRTEWAPHWDKTLERWYGEGVPHVENGLPHQININRYFGLDQIWQFCLPMRTADCPKAAYHGAPVLYDEEDYAVFREKYLCTDALLEDVRRGVEAYLKADPDGEFVFWLTLEGFFWYPRTLFGIENHLYAFYDHEELMLQMNRDACEFYKKALPIVFERVHPQFMTFAEDMSYNHGPMLSHEQFEKFVRPFYEEIVPILKSVGTKVFIDTDGFVEPLIPWFLECGIEGILPLERQAGVDINRIRAAYPQLLMLGAYDKTVMKNGEATMRAEFERIRPVIQSGRYIPGVDHQTPPDVSVENYRTYLRLLREYTVYEK